MTMKKILAVIRESSNSQDSESQKREMRDFCISKGFKEEAIVYIESVGASAHKVNKQYLEMLETIKTTILNDPDMNTCAFWHLNRLGRRKKYIAGMEDWFVENKIQVYVKIPSIQLLNEKGEKDANASISFSVFAAMVELETEEMFAKMQRGRDEARLKGKWLGGGSVRYGYQVIDGYLYPKKEEADIVSTIYKMYATGQWSTVKLTRELDARGITLRGTRLSNAAVAKIIRDKGYLGSTTGTIYEGIISPELWHTVRDIAEGRRKKYSDKGSNGKIHLALKILQCSDCGHYYSVSDSLYICYNKRSRNRQLDPSTITCNSPSVNKDMMDSLVWDVACMCHMDASLKLKRESAKEYKSELEICIMKVNRLREKIDLCSERLKRNTELYVNGDIDKKVYDKNKNKITKDRDIQLEELKKYEAEGKKLHAMVESAKEASKPYQYYANAAKELDDMTDMKRKKEIVQRYISYATIEYDKDPTHSRRRMIIHIDTITDMRFTFRYNPWMRKQGKDLYILKNDEFVEYRHASVVVSHIAECR